MAYTPYTPEADDRSEKIVEAILNRAEEFSRGYRLGSLEKENEILKEVNENLREELERIVKFISGDQLLPQYPQSKFDFSEVFNLKGK